ncbi:RNA polymerase sigma factor [Sphingobacterium siyangense]|uniref:RNA polymerase sigma factor n=1 Tax=Sphingobacterium siyangense TaxID=459529 RepID=UPI003DA22979
MLHLISTTVYNKLSDIELIDLLNQYDHNAYTEIYERYWSVLYVHAFRILQHEDEALDSIQNVFENLWNKAGSLVVQSSLKAYLFTSVRNSSLNAIEKSKTRSMYIDSLNEFVDIYRSSTEEELYFKELLKKFESEIENLPPKMREIFLKSRNEGLSYKKIAKELNITENTVKTVLHRAVLQLKKKLNTLITFLF